MASPAAVVTVGGIGSSLSPNSIYAVASFHCKVKIDSSALEKLSQSKKSSPMVPIPLQSDSTKPIFLTSEESRSAILVLLNKLFLAEAAIRPALPLLIEETLNLTSGHETLDFGSSFRLLDSIYSLNALSGKKVDEIGVTVDEISVMESSYAASIGILAILDCCSSALIKVSDAVAALSCEAIRADAAAIDLSGDSSNKDEIEVARDMKVYLFGSKLIGKVESEVFNENPTDAHGRFRKAVRILHSHTREELKSSIKVNKTMGVRNLGKEELLLYSVFLLARSIRSMGRISIERSRSSISYIADQDLRSKVIESFEKSCPSFDVLRRLYARFHSTTENVVTGSDFIEALHYVYESFVKLREIIAWEAALALFALEMDDSIEKTQVGPKTSIKSNGENTKGEKKSEKKKKTLGKGTSVVRQLLTDHLSRGKDTSIRDITVLIEWARELALYFDPHDIGLDVLLRKMKEILESNDARRLPKIPKGTRDFGKEQMTIRERAFSIITNVFKMHGAVRLDTPVFELRETLMGKYGEDSKLIYDLADQGGELCSLRYDLTVPFARYLAMNNLNALKRYQIAKVYRRDNPSKGRYREFYQCDFDIAGQYETMEPDFEVIKVLTQLLDGLSIGDYEIKLNHRKLLDGMLEICGVSSEKFRTVCSSIDKLDKQTFEQIKKELVEEKGLTVEEAEKIGSFVKKRGAPFEILSELKKEGSQFLENDGSVVALNELEILFGALEKCKCLNRVVFDLSLARGLDYYTGVIFEAVFKGSTQVGSIAAGGRYDNLVGMFSGKQVPAVGVSLGIERVFTIMEQLEKDRNQVIRSNETEVLAAVLGKDLLVAAELVGELWDADIKTEFGLTKRVMNHINRAKQSVIPWMVIVGESELNKDVVKLKNIEANQEEEIPRKRLVEELKKRLKT